MVLFGKLTAPSPRLALASEGRLITQQQLQVNLRLSCTCCICLPVTYRKWGLVLPGNLTAAMAHVTVGWLATPQQLQAWLDSTTSAPFTIFSCVK